MEDGFRIPIGNHVNLDDVDWSMHGSTAYNYRSTNGHGQLISPESIELLMQNMTLYQNPNFALSTSLSMSPSRTGNGLATRHSAWPNSHQMAQHSLISPSSSDSNDDNYLNGIDIPYGPSHGYTPYYFMQGPSSLSTAYRDHNDDHLYGLIAPWQPPPPPPLHDSLTDEIDRMVQDQERCRELQDTLERELPARRREIFAAARPRLRDHAVQKYGNYFVQKLIEVSVQADLRDMVSDFTARKQSLKNICTNENGNKVMLKLVDRLRWNVELQMVLMEGVSEIAVELTKNTNCKQLIENCLELFAREPKELFLNEIANHCTDIAKDKIGCCILQKCFLQDNLQIFYRLVNSVTQSASTLSQHTFGNYIVQFVIELELPFVAQLIAVELKGQFVTLSKDVHSSNVVEKLMKSDPKVAQLIICEMIESPYHLLEVLQDQYGNFVGQTALKVSESKRLVVYYTLKRIIENHAGQLRNHPHGRNVVRAIRNGQNLARHTYNRRQ